MSVLKIKDQNGNWVDIPAIKGANGRDGAIQYQAGKNISLENNTISTSALNESEVQDLIDTSIEALGELGFTPTVVQTLPTQDIDTHTIYLVPKQDSEQEDAYDEWLYINNSWEHIGSTTVDLSNYYTKSESDAITGLLANLNTTNKANLVGAINEVFSNAGIPVLSGNTIRLNNVDYGVYKIQDTATIYGVSGATITIEGGAILIVVAYGNLKMGYVFARNGNISYIAYSTVTTKNFLQLLERSNTVEYTPAPNSYNPATTKYVDDAISTAITDALGGSY